MLATDGAAEPPEPEDEGRVEIGFWRVCGSRSPPTGEGADRRPGRWTEIRRNYGALGGVCR